MVKEIKAAAKRADAVYLATDPDREGEAIAWHLVEAAELDDRATSASSSTRSRPRPCERPSATRASIDMHLVDAQQARRILDRLVGYKLSPLLWKKVRGRPVGGPRAVGGGAAGRGARARDPGFVPEEYWTIEAELAAGRRRQAGELPRPAGRPGGQAKKLEIGGRARGRPHASRLLETAAYRVACRPRSSKRGGRRRPSSPAPSSRRRRAGWASPPSAPWPSPSSSTKAWSSAARAGRPHHLHAHRLHPRGGIGAGGGARATSARSTAPTTCRRRPASTREVRGRRRRTRPSAPPPPTASRRPSSRFLIARPVPALQAHLAAVRRQPDGRRRSTT